jgi:hypothetical protein
MAFIFDHIGESSVPLLKACGTISLFGERDGAFEEGMMIGHAGFLGTRGPTAWNDDAGESELVLWKRADIMMGRIRFLSE